MITLMPFENLHEADYELSFAYEFGDGYGYRFGYGYE